MHVIPTIEELRAQQEKFIKELEQGKKVVNQQRSAWLLMEIQRLERFIKRLQAPRLCEVISIDKINQFNYQQFKPIREYFT